MEHTMAGLAGTSLTLLDFHSFFDLCTTTAKHIDKINQIKSAKQREINLAQQQAGRGGRGGRGGRDATTQGRGEGREVAAEEGAPMQAVVLLHMSHVFPMKSGLPCRLLRNKLILTKLQLT